LEAFGRRPPNTRRHLSSGRHPKPFDPVTEYVPTARPGSRAPHVWLQRRGEQLSTIDLFGPHFVLLVGRDGDAWCKALHQIEPSCTIGKEGDLIDTADNWHEAYGVGTEGAVLVRPDGYVAWRSRSGTSEPGQVLRAVFDDLLGRIRLRHRQ
jgi:putative polyketide hydroxylase